ncbi:MAG: hypothetical protein ACYDAK_06100 [Candidatus Limnocylindrales bacterium]
MGEKGLGTDPGVVGTGAPNPGAGGGDTSSGARAKGTVVIKNMGGGGTLDRQPGDPSPLGGPGIVGTGPPNPGIVAADLNADGAADRATGEDTWVPPAGVGEAPSEEGGLGGKAGTLTVSGTPGGTAVDRGIGSPMGGSADRGAVKTIDGLEHEHEIVQYRESTLE